MNSIAIRTQLAAIARHLPGFSLDPEREYLIGPKGERLYLNGHNKRGMFTIGMGLGAVRAHAFLPDCSIIPTGRKRP